MNTSGLLVLCRLLTAPPIAVMLSTTVKDVGASLNVKVTTELVLPSFKPASAIVTATLGLSVSTGTVALPPAPTLPTASV